MLDRIARRPIGKKRAFVKDEDLEYYCALDEPIIDLDNLQEETKEKIQNLEYLLDLRLRMRVDRNKGKQLEEEYNQLVNEAIWEPKIWLYQK